MKFIILFIVLVNTSYAAQKAKPLMIMNVSCDIKQEIAHVELAKCYDNAHKSFLWSIKTDKCWENFNKTSYCNTQIIKDI
jgi:hypothetical protein